MATMWPRSPPEWVRNEPRREAELKVFRRLDECLDSSWSVYYSRPWWGLNAGGGEVDGEADFIVAHPDKGILFLEVKGGGIDYEPATSQWTTTNRTGFRKKIKNPVDQAVKSKHEYLKKLKSFPDWPKEFIRLRHGVIFPDADERETRYGFLAGFEREIFCLARLFSSDFGGWLEERLSSHMPDGFIHEAPPGRRVIALLERIVAEPAKLTVPAGRNIDPLLDQQDMLMTGHQLAAVTLLREVSRAIIVGGAGTGKTLLACEMAARYARDGQPTALVCLSEPLAAWLKARLESWPEARVFDFHSFCSEIIRLAGRRFEGRPEALPEVATRALASRFEVPWHAVIVDEGQDLLPSWWDVFEGIVKWGLPRLRVFYDSNQAVYARKDDLETRLKMEAFPLGHNLRNSQRIGAVAAELYAGPRLETVGPDGDPVLLSSTTTEDVMEMAAQRLVSLTREELVRSGDIAVLVPSEEWISGMGKAAAANNVAWTRARPAHGNLVTIETIARFKGLESPVIILLVDRATSNDQAMSYVAVTRARARLEVFGSAMDTVLERAVQAGQQRLALEGK